jgi:hypothetical protein
MLIKKLQMMPWSFKVGIEVQFSRFQLKFQGLNALKKKQKVSQKEQPWQPKLEKIQSNKPLTK